MKDLFNHVDIDSVEDYKVAILNTRNHRYICFLKKKPDNHSLSEYLQRSDYVIRDNELIKNRLGEVNDGY